MIERKIIDKNKIDRIFIGIWFINCLFEDVILQSRLVSLVFTLLYLSYVLSADTKSLARRFRFEDVLLILAMLTYRLGGNKSFFVALYYAMSVWVVYAFAKAYSSKSEKDTNLRLLIWSSILAYAVHGFLDFSNAFKYGALEDQVWESFITGTYRPRSHYDFYMIMISATIFYGLYKVTKGQKSGWLIISASMFSQIFVLFCHGRTVTVVAICVIILGAGIIMIKKNGIQKAISLGGIIILFVGFVIMWFVEEGKLLLPFSGSWIFSEGGGIFHNMRFEIMRRALLSIYNNPFGGSLVEYEGSLWFAHNSWLDMGVQAGVVPFVLIIAFTVISLFYYCKMLKANINIELLILVASEYLALFLYNAEEPAIISQLTYWTAWIFMAGCVRGIIDSNKSEKIINDNVH